MPPPSPPFAAVLGCGPVAQDNVGSLHEGFCALASKPEGKLCELRASFVPHEPAISQSAPARASVVMRASAKVTPTHNSNVSVLKLAKEFGDPKPDHLVAMASLTARDKNMEHMARHSLQCLCSGSGSAQC